MPNRKSITWLLVALALGVVSAIAAEPALSGRVRALIDAKGVEAARQELPMLVMTEMGGAKADEAGMLALVDAYIESGDLEAAELVATVQMVAGNSADVVAKLGDVYMAKGIPLAASVFYQQVLAADPGHEHAKSRLAEITESHPEVLGFANAETPPAPVAKRSEPSSAVGGQAREQPRPPARNNKDADDLLPYVIVTDPGEMATLDFDELRTRAGTAYPSRWDDLTLVDSCLWISPETLEKHLGVSEPLSAVRSDFQCKYRVRTPDGYADETVMMQVYVERHPTSEIVREKKRSFTEGVSVRQFTPFDAGASDLEVYVHHKGKYLYAFPRDGRTMWRIGYMGEGPERDKFYEPDGEAGMEQGFGPRYIRLLVETYGGRL